MSATWDDKAPKATPVAADEVLIIDTEDSRNQKRATLSTLGFGIDSINALTASAQFIAGGTGIDVVSITDTHTISVDSTVAKIDLANTFTELNTFTEDISIVKDENGDAKLNLTVFSDAFDIPTIFASRARGTLATPTAVQSGDVLLDVDARGHDGTNFDIGGFYGFSAAGNWTGTSHPTNLEFATTNVDATSPAINLTILPDGTADFMGHIITNAILDVELDNGSIHVGNQANSSESYFAQLETKAECLAATTFNITLANSQTIDGIAVVNPNRVLVKDQTDASENGIYEVVDAGAWTRTTDANTSALVNNGMFTKITFGTVNANTAWVLSTPDPITLDTTNLTIDQFSLSDIAHLNSSQTFTGENTFREDVNIIKDGGPATIVLTTFDDFDGVFIDGRRAEGSEATPTPVVNNSNLISLGGFGYDGTSFEIGGLFEFNAAGTWTTISHPTRFDLFTVDVGSTSLVTQFSIAPDGTASFQDNSITDIASILLNDSDDSNTYTILGGALAADFNVTIPAISANDTFALLGVDQTFSGSNSFASDILLQRADGAEIDIIGTTFSNSSGDRSEFSGRKARGTPSTPLAVLDGDSLTGFEGIGFDGTQFSGGFNAAILLVADGDFTDAPNRPTRIELRTTPPNSTDVDPRLVVNSLGQTSFEDNPIINIGSILLNDDDDSNAYTILGGSLTGDFNVTIPAITANDNFVLSGISNTYTAGARQDFLGLLAGTSGLNVGGIAGNPTTQVNGDIWLNTSTNTLFGRINGVDVDLGSTVTGTVNTVTSGLATVTDPTTINFTDTVGGVNFTAVDNSPTATITASVDSGYTGGSSIVTVGTIASGIWNATTIDVIFGGTGNATLAEGGILLGNGIGPITATAVLGDGEILIGDGTTNPVALDVGSSTAITILGTVTTGVWNGTDIAVADGGTGVSTFAAGGILFGNGTTNILATLAPTSGQIIVGNTTVPAFVTMSGDATIDNTGALSLISTVVKTDQANTWSTGIQSFVAASNLRIPVSATPTIAVDGDIAYDTTMTDFSTGLVKFFGTEEQGIVAMPIAEFASPVDGNVIAYNAANTEFELAPPSATVTTQTAIKSANQTITDPATDVVLTDLTITLPTRTGGFSNLSLHLLVTPTTNNSTAIFEILDDGTPILERQVFIGDNAEVNIPVTFVIPVALDGSTITVTATTTGTDFDVNGGGTNNQNASKLVSFEVS